MKSSDFGTVALRAGVTGSRASYTWEFEVRRRDTPVDSSWGTIRDFTGDGYDDLLMFSGALSTEVPLSLYIAEGGPSGPTAPRVLAPVGSDAQFGRPRIGDFDGDGRGDIAYSVNLSGRYAIDVVQSTRDGSYRYQSQEHSSELGFDVSPPAVIDWNGDGYSDLVATVRLRGSIFPQITGSMLIIYRGSPTGLSLRPQEAVALPDQVTRPAVAVMVELADVDVDGFGDVFILDWRPATFEYGKFVLHRRAGGATQVDTFPTLPVPADVAGDVAYVDNIGDLDGDGLGDLTVRSRDFGAFYVYRHDAGRLAPFVTVRESPPAGGDADFGSRIEGADLNGDGMGDLLVRSVTSATETWLNSGLPYNAGRMYVYFGSSRGLQGAPIWFDRVRPTDPMDNPGGFAGEIASPGDLNADGFDDAAVVDFSRSAYCYVMGGSSLVGSHLGECTPVPGEGYRVF